MSIRALFPTFFLMLMAGCVVRAQSPDAAPPVDSAPDTFVECKADGPAVLCDPLGLAESRKEICDPVCQTGCNWCNSGKCTYGNEGQIYCGLKQIPKDLKGLMEPCEVFEHNSKDQIDNCAPGLVCLRPVDGELSGYCFRPCRIPAFDCNQGDYQYDCALRPLAPKFFDVDPVKVKACNPSPSLNCQNSNCCDPTKDREPGNANCTDVQVCRLLNIDKDGINSRTTCDLGNGVGLKYADCKSNLDCGTKHSCINGKCRQICDRNLGLGKDFCAVISKCVPHGAQYGYCDP